MIQRRWTALVLAVVMAACLLGGCSWGSQGDLLALNYGSINKMLQEDGVQVTVTSSDTLNEAVAAAALTLEGAARPDSAKESSIKTQIARQTGTMPLICTVYDRDYWSNSLLGTPDRHEKTAVSFAEQLYQKGNGSAYEAAVASFTTKEGDRMILFVMSK